MSGHRIVWILGAGFSKPLGGPLLADLFTPASPGNLEARYPRAKYDRLVGVVADLVRYVYQYGLGLGQSAPLDRFGTFSPERLWENAEEFLEYLDTATVDGESPEWRRLTELVNRYKTSRLAANPSLKFPPYDEPNQRRHIGATARRLLAAECSAFLRDVQVGSPHSEKWIPYETWWSRLTPDRRHTIITFNYDLVVERLDLGRSKIQIVEPSALRALHHDRIPLIKLHGSVDWKRVEVEGGPVQYETGQADDFALTCQDDELAIATPGLTKRAMVSEGFNALWDRAETALMTADAIVFVGYRFPPTDSEALSRLLGAIGRNDNLYIALHTVLGPNKSDDIARLHSLLRYAARETNREHTSVVGMDAIRGLGEGGRRAYTLVPQALWSQDFLLVTQPHQIEQPYLTRWE